jgi:sugar lactone lactonase YvrE
MAETEILLDGLAFPEGPRWHRGRLYFSDMHALRVMAVDVEGKAEEIVRVDAWPSGLGWLPDGRMLIVSMTDRRLLRLERDGRLAQAADLSALASFHCNDMVVDGSGVAYVGNFGFDLHARAPQRTAELIRVTPEGTASVVARDLAFPNGTVITPDGRALIVGESMGARLTAFDLAPDGSLSNRRTWAPLEGAIPDGICLDQAGGIWVASPVSAEALRVLKGGQVTHRVRVQTQAYACMLGGADGRTLFIATAATSVPDECRERRSGRIETCRAPYPHAGWP